MWYEINLIITRDGFQGICFFTEDESTYKLCMEYVHNVHDQNFHIFRWKSLSGGDGQWCNTVMMKIISKDSLSDKSQFEIRCVPGK